MNNAISVKKLALDFNNNKTLKFIVIFITLFVLFNSTNKLFNSFNTPTSRFYTPFFSENLNYIQFLRSTIIICSVTVLKWLGYTMMYSKTQLLAIGGIPCNINYSCLGLGVISFWAAFVIAFPKPTKEKIKFLILGILSIFILNITRMVLLVIATVKAPNDVKKVNYQHDIFNIIVYFILLVMIYFWIKTPKK
ncbi:MAG: exosortase/archaeosortase family protein [Sphingobacteriales bacterium]|nr:MAG: exosortase/archaeosortase family protein [Sphingobacteriales bacterium]